MTKRIEQTFETKVNKVNYFITARNFNSHYFSINGGQNYSLTTDQMREVANFLIKSADLIDGDDDFKKTL